MTVALGYSLGAVTQYVLNNLAKTGYIFDLQVGYRGSVPIVYTILRASEYLAKVQEFRRESKIKFHRQKVSCSRLPASLSNCITVYKLSGS